MVSAKTVPGKHRKGGSKPSGSPDGAGDAPRAPAGALETLRRTLAQRFVRELALVLLIGAAVQSFAVAYSWGNLDSGQYMQGALAVARGGFPLVTFSSRSDPFNLFLLAPVVYLFGSSVTVGLSVQIVLNVGTATVLAVLARRFAYRRGDLAGIVTAGAYLLIPFILTIDTNLLEEPFEAFFVVLSLYFLLRDKWSPSAYNYPIAGLLLGVAILTRRSTVALGFAWLFWIFYMERDWSSRIVRSIKCMLPGILIVIGLYSYVAYRTSLTWAIAAMVRSPYLPYGQFAVNLSSRIELIGYYMAMAVPLYLVPMALGVRELRARGKERMAAMLGSVFTGIIFALLAAYQSFAQWGIGEIESPWIAYVLLAAGLVWIAVIARELLGPPPASVAPGPFLFIVLGWGLAILVTDFLPRPQQFVNYAEDAAAPLALLFGLWFSTLAIDPRELAATTTGVPGKPAHRKRAYLVPIVISLLIVLSGVLTAVLVLGPTVPENVPGFYGLPEHNVLLYPTTEVNQVATQLRHLVAPNQKVFSFDTVFLSASNIQNSPQISIYLDPYIAMLQVHAPPNSTLYPNAPKGLDPTIDQLLSYWNSTNLGWVVDGPLTQKAMENSPLLNWYFTTEFYPLQSFGDPLSYDYTIILERGTPPTTAPLSPFYTVVGPSIPAAVVYTNGVTYTAFLGTPYVTGTVPGKKITHLNLAFPGARSLGVFAGDLWVGSSETPQIEVFPLSGGKPEVLTAGSGPSDFVGNATSGPVFVSAISSGNVTEVVHTSNLTWWKIGWSKSFSGGISSMAWNSTTQHLYLAALSPNSIITLDSVNGKKLSSTALKFPPFALTLEGGELLAAWWIGYVYQFMPHRNGDLQLTRSVFVGAGIDTLIPDPSVNGVFVPAQSDRTLTVLSATTLFTYGEFRGAGCVDDIAWNPATSLAIGADVCGNKTLFWRLPQPTMVAFQGPEGSNMTLNSDEGDATYDLPVMLPLWSQEISATLQFPGHLQGAIAFSIFPGETSVSPWLSPGPSLAGLHQLQEDFTAEVVAAGILMFGAVVYVLCREEPDNHGTGSRPGPRPTSEAPPKGPSEASDSVPGSTVKPS